MQIIISILLIFTGIIAIAYFSNRSKKKRLIDTLREYWGKQVKTDFAFDKIGIYHHKIKAASGFHTVSSDQIADLNLDAVFTQLDRTISKCGQQYLYDRLLSPCNVEAVLNQWDKATAYFAANAAVREKILYQLTQLKKHESYYLPQLIFNPPQEKPGYLNLVPLLVVAALFSVVMLFFDPSYIYLLLFVVIINFILHYFTKNKTKEYIQSFKSLQKLFETGAFMAGMELPVADTETLNKELKVVKPLRKYLSIINLEPETSGNIAMPLTLVVEPVKILLLLDITAFYNSLKYLAKMKDSIHSIYKAIGFIDAAIATASFRAGLPYYTKPVFTTPGKQLLVEKMYHPLVQDCISNSLKVENQSILITGSNMSGKTTFIRTVAINALLAQTICTCLAARYEAPFLKVLSSIVIADNITEGKSYYFKELERVLTLIREADKDTQCLFILDECFKGTNTIERIASSKEVLSYLNRSQHIVLIATHDLELSELLKNQYQLYHFSEVIKDDTLSFDYQLKPGILKTRNAIRLLELSGYPREIVENATMLSRNINFLEFTL